MAAQRSKSHLRRHPPHEEFASGTTFARLRLRTSLAPWPRPPKRPPPRVGVTAATISFGVLHKKGPPRLKGAQIAPGRKRAGHPPVTSTPKASIRFATFLWEREASAQRSDQVQKEERDGDNRGGCHRCGLKRYDIFHAMLLGPDAGSGAPHLSSRWGSANAGSAHSWYALACATNREREGG